MTVVVDSSALLAVVHGEPGSHAALLYLRGARLSAVNYSETMAKVSDQAVSPDKLHDLIDTLQVEIVSFDQRYARAAADLRSSTRRNNVSFADRACLAQAIVDCLPLVTADRDWSALGLGIEIVQIR